MQTTLTKEKDNIVILNMTIPANEADSAYNLAANRISQYVNINGFRKGKAPKSVVERHVGVDRIQQEALDMLLPRYISQAISENKLDTVTQPALTSYNYEPGQDLQVTIQVETRPEFTIGTYKGMELKAEIAPEDKGALDNAINNFLTQNSSLELVLDRPSKDTDIVVFDFDGTCNGEKIQGGSAKGYALDLAHSNFIPGFAEQLVGHNLKEEFTIDVKFPEEYHDKKLQGQDAKFDIKLNEIKQRVLPELNDELVKKATRFSTVDELKSDIQSFIDTQRENAKRLSAENAAFKSIVDSTSIDIPQTMIDREVRAIANDYQQRIANQGGNWAQFVEAQGGETKFAQTLSEDAKIRIKNSLIVDKISKEENLTVGQEDLTSRLTQLSMAYGTTPEQLVKQFGQNPTFVNSLSQQVINDKVRDFLIDNNKFEYVEVEPAKEEKETKAKKKSSKKAEKEEEKTEA
ncbi:trigger factor [bacterium]|nr:trigger factor [bacterium]